MPLKRVLVSEYNLQVPTLNDHGPQFPHLGDIKVSGAILEKTEVVRMPDLIILKV